MGIETILGFIKGKEKEGVLPACVKDKILDLYKERVSSYLLVSRERDWNYSLGYLAFTKTRIINLSCIWDEYKHKHKFLDSNSKVLDCLDFKTLYMYEPSGCGAGFVPISSQNEQLLVFFSRDLWTFPRLQNEILNRLSKMLNFNLNKQLKPDEYERLQKMVQSDAGQQSTPINTQQSNPTIGNAQPNIDNRSAPAMGNAQPDIDELLKKKIAYMIAPNGSVTIYNIEKIYNVVQKTMTLQDSVAIMK